MYDYERLKENLRKFSEPELFFKDRYEALGNSEKWEQFCEKYPKESILEKGYLCPEFFPDFEERGKPFLISFLIRSEYREPLPAFF